MKWGDSLRAREIEVEPLRGRSPSPEQSARQRRNARRIPFLRKSQEIPRSMHQLLYDPGAAPPGSPFLPEQQWLFKARDGWLRLCVIKSPPLGELVEVLFPRCGKRVSVQLVLLTKFGSALVDTRPSASAGFPSGPLLSSSVGDALVWLWWQIVFFGQILGAVLCRLGRVFLSRCSWTTWELRPCLPFSLSCRMMFVEFLPSRWRSCWFVRVFTRAPSWVASWFRRASGSRVLAGGVHLPGRCFASGAPLWVGW